MGLYRGNTRESFGEGTVEYTIVAVVTQGYNVIQLQSIYIHTYTSEITDEIRISSMHYTNSDFLVLILNYSCIRC